MIEETKLSRLVPASCFYVSTVSDEITTQREHQHERVLGQRVDGVPARVADGDVVAPAMREIDVVDAGCGDGDEL